MALTVLSDDMLPSPADSPLQINTSAYDESAILNDNVTDGSNITTAQIAEQTFKELFLHSDFGYLVLMLLVSAAWVIFISLFSSRCWGLLFSYVVNRLLKPTDGTIWEFSLRKSFSARENVDCIQRQGVCMRFAFANHTGSIEISFLAGKVMFGGLQIITQDYRLYVNDGYVIFRWWWRYEPVAFEEYFKSSSRLLVYLSGVDYYQFNSYEKFVNLERKYNEEISGLLGGGDPDNNGGIGDRNTGASAPPDDKTNGSGLTNDEIRRGFLDWRSFLPVTEIEAQYVRLVFGNGNAPSLLAASTDLFRMRYTVTTASTAVDPLMHVMAGSIKSTRIGFLPSPDYRGGTAERVSSLFEPTQVPNGYKSMFECDRLSFNHYMDQPAEKVHDIVSDVESAASPLMSWGLDLMLSKKAVILYGPWADEQRDLVYRSLSPVDRLPVTPSSLFDRQYESLIIKVKTEDQLALTVSFTGDNKGREERMSMQFGPLSWMEMRIPWIIGPAGLTATFVSHIEKFTSSTTMHMSKLIESDTWDLKFDLHFPLIWNAPQIWEISLSFSKATAHILFYHKDFLRLLFEDWSNQRYADILRHVPFTMRCRIHFEDFELITFVNEHNWVDCMQVPTKPDENAYLAFCGSRCDLEFQLPFTDFMPEFMLSRVTLTAERIDLKLLLPESNTHYHGLLSLHSSARIRSQIAENSSTTSSGPISPISEWSSFTSSSNWMCCWSAGTVSVDINYRYHGLPLLKPGQQLCGPTRGNWRQKLRQLALDECTVHVALTNSKVYLSGALVRFIYIFKSNYFGVDDHYTSMHQPQNEAKSKQSTELLNVLLKKSSVFAKEYRPDAVFDETVDADDEHIRSTILHDENEDLTSLQRIRQARPIQVYLSLIVRGVEGHLLRHCDDPVNDPPCPSIYIESIHLEVDKKYLDCKVQVIAFPILICVADNVWRPLLDKWCSEGQLLLTFIQYRAHGYYSDANMPLGHETVEYAWLQDVQLGDILGRLSAPQLYELIACVETLLVFMQNAEDELQRPGVFQECHHLQLQPVCTKFNASKLNSDIMQSKNVSEPAKTSETTVSDLSDEEVADEICPSADDIKYSMLRFSVDAIQVHISESHAAIVIDVNRIWLGQCSLANDNTAGCLNLFVPHAVVHQFVRSDQLSSNSSEQKAEFLWLEAGSVDFGTIECVYRMQTTIGQRSDVDMAKMQREFLYEHDMETQRLYFLHGNDNLPFCGCYGGCKFFGCHYSPPFESVLKPLFRPGHDREPQQLWQGHSLLHPGWNIFPRRQSGVINSLLTDAKADEIDEKTNKTGLSVPNNEQQHTNQRHSSRISNENPKNSREIVNEILAGHSQTDSRQYGRSAPDSDTARPPPAESHAKFGHTRKMSSISGAESFYSAQSGGTRNSSRRSSTHIMPPPHFLEQNDADVVLTNETSAFRPVLAGEIDLTSAQNADKYAGGVNLLTRRNSTVSSVTISASEMSETAADRMVDVENDSIAARVENGADFDADDETARGFYPKTDDADSLTPAGDDNMAAGTSHTTSSSENIDLHHQMTIPVLDSPMLMAGYRSVLSQSQCLFYSFRLFSNNSTANLDPGAEIVGNSRMQFSQPTVTAVLPVFKSFMHGEARQFEAVEKSSRDSDETLKHPTLRSHAGDEKLNISADVGNAQTSVEVFLRSTIVFHLTPLSIEAVDSCIETLEPIASRYRPLSVLNRLYSLCLSDARAKVQFDENLYMAQHANKLFGSPSPDNDVVNSDFSPSAIVPAHSSRVLNDKSSKSVENSYCEQHSHATAFSLNIAAVSISFIQVGIADEVVNLSHLDNPLDILCISSLMVGVKTLKASSLVKSNEKRFVVLHENAKNASDFPNLSKKLLPASNSSHNFVHKRFRTDTGGESRSKLAVSASSSSAMLSLLPSSAKISRLHARSLIETSLVATAAIQYVHLQLRRVLTPGISARQCSRTQISCINDADSSCWFALHAKNSVVPSFLMMETGIEQLELQGYRRSGSSSTPERREDDDEIQNSTANPPPVVVLHSPPPNDDDIEQQNEAENLPNPNENYDEDEDVSISSASVNGAAENDDNFSVRIEQEQVVVKIINDAAESATLAAEKLPKSKLNTQSSDVDAEKRAENNASQPKTDANKDVSSWVMSIGSTWLNLPAASHIRHRESAHETFSSSSNDWYFQTTLLPAVWAWLTPCRRLSNVVEKLMQHFREDSLVVISCLMSSALDNRMRARRSVSLLPPLTSIKRQHITLHAFALRQNASCRLVRILQKYLFENSASDEHADVLKALRRENVPPIDVVEQGVAVLLREWKKQMFAADKSQKNLVKTIGLKAGSARKLLNKPINLLSHAANQPSGLNFMPSSRPAALARAFLAPISENAHRRAPTGASSRRLYVNPDENDEAENARAAPFAQQQHATQYGSTAHRVITPSAPAGTETDADELMQSDLYNYLQHEKQQFMAKPIYTTAANTGGSMPTENFRSATAAAPYQPHIRRQSTSSLHSHHSASSPRPHSSALVLPNLPNLPDLDSSSVFRSFASHVGLHATSATRLKNMATSGLLELTKHVGLSCKIMLSLNELKLVLIESCIIRPTQANLVNFEQDEHSETAVRRRWCAFTSGGLKCDARLSVILHENEKLPSAALSQEPVINLYYAVTLGKVMQAVDLATLRVLLQVATLIGKMMNEPRYAVVRTAATKRHRSSASGAPVVAGMSRSSSSHRQSSRRKRHQRQETSASGGGGGGISPAVSLSHVPPSSLSDSTITGGRAAAFYADGNDDVPPVAAGAGVPVAVKYSSLIHEHTPQCWKRLYFLMDLANSSSADATAVPDEVMHVNEQTPLTNAAFRQASFSQRFRRRPTKPNSLLRRAAAGAADETAFGREISTESAGSAAAAAGFDQQNSSFFAQPYFQQQNSTGDLTANFLPSDSADSAKTAKRHNYSRNLMPLILSQTHAVLNVSGSVRLEAIQLNANVLGLKLSIAMEDFNLVPTYCMLRPKNAASATILAGNASLPVNTVNTLSISAGVNKLLLRLLEDDDEKNDAEKRPTNEKVAAGNPSRRPSILSVRIGPCSANYSKAFAKRFGTLKHVASIGIAAIRISLPQNPALVHSLVTKRSENLTTTIDELRRFTTTSAGGGGANQPQVVNNEADTWVAHHSTMLGNDNDDDDAAAAAAEYYYADENEHVTHADDGPLALAAARHHRRRMRRRRPNDQIVDETKSDDDDDLPILINAQIRELRIESSVLPSLKAVYHMPEALVFGLVATNHESDSSASVDIPRHSLSFVSKVNRQYNLAPSARFDLPDLTVSICYGPAPYYEALLDAGDSSSVQPVRANGLLKLFVTIGSPEYRITTDLLNYVILIQSVFMQELRDVIEKISSSANSSSRNSAQKKKKSAETSRNLPSTMHRSRSEPSSPNFSHKNRPPPPPKLPTAVPLMPKVDRTYRPPSLPLLFQVQIQQEALRILASTTTGSAVRLDTSRLAVISTNLPNNASSAQNRRAKRNQPVVMMNEFGSVRLSAQIDVMLALGQLVKSEKMLYEEAEPDFQPMALFKSRLQVSNHVVTVQQQRASGNADMPTPSTNSKRSHEVETPTGTTNTSGSSGLASGKQESRVLAVLQHPYLYTQPRAADTALWFYFNYRSAYQSFVSQRERVDLQQQQQKHSSSIPSTPTTPTAATKRFSIDPKDVALATLRRKSSTKIGLPRSVPRQSVEPDGFGAENDENRPTAAAGSSYTAVVFQFLVYQAQICIPLQSNSSKNVAGRLNPMPMFNSADTAADLDGTADAVDDDVDAYYSPALLISLNSARVKALWTDESVITTGQFDKFTMHFSDDHCGGAHFEHIIDPSMLAVLEVPQGTAQLCSRSVSEQRSAAGFDKMTTFAKWFVQIKWNMHGIVLNIDTNIGRNVSALVETLASMANKQIGGGGGGVGTEAGQEEKSVEQKRMEKQNSTEFFDDPAENYADEKGSFSATNVSDPVAATPDEFFVDALTDPVAEPAENAAATKNRAQLEREMVARASRLHHLMQTTGEKRATEDEIEAETRQLHNIEAQLSYDVRRDVFGRLGQRAATKTTPDEGPTSTGVAEQSPDKSKKPTKTVSIADLPPGEQQQPQVELDLAVIMLIDSGKCNFYMRQVVSTAEPTSKRVGAGAAAADLPSKTGGGKLQQNVNKLRLLSDRLKLGRNKATAEAELAEKQTRHVKRSSLASTLTAGTVGGGSSGLQMAEQLTSTLHLPGITMRAHYKSQNNSNSAENVDSTLKHRPFSAAAVENEAVFQRSSLHAVMTLLSMPGETRVSPKMLDFVEQVLQRVGYNNDNRRDAAEKPTKAASHAPKRSLSDTGAAAAAAKQRLTRENSAPPPTALTAASVPSSTTSVDSSKSESDLAATAAGGVLVADNTFPIDVYFCLKVRPSVIRCFCEPVSKVQALVQLPSFEVMLSSKNSSTKSFVSEPVSAPDDEIDADEADLNDSDAFFQQKSRRNLPVWAEKLQTAATSARSGKIDGNMPSNISSPSSAHVDNENENSIMSSGGISATAVISDFALIIFHPYGTMPAPSSGMTTVATGLGLSGKISSTGSDSAATHRSETFASFGTMFREAAAAQQGAGTSAGAAGTTDFSVYTTRKELLRLQVDAIRIHLSRWKAAKEFAAQKSTKNELRQRKNSVDAAKISPIRFTCILNIGKTSFQYDMRRLPEIMAFPKAFYRKSILRRFFLGDESGTTTKVPTSYEQKPQSAPNTAEKAKSFDAADTAGGLGTIAEQDESNMPSSAEPNSAKKSPLNAGDTSKLLFFNEKAAADHHQSSKKSKTTSVSSGSTVLTWKTLVSVSLNVSAIDVHMNIGNVLGATLLSIENFQSLGRFSAASDGHRNMYVSGDCHRLLLESKGGIIGTLCTLVDLEAFGHVQRDARTEPRNTIGFKFRRLETRFDYMAATSMMMRLSNFELTAADKWNIAHLAGAGGVITPRAVATKEGEATSEGVSGVAPKNPMSSPNSARERQSGTSAGGQNSNFTTHYVSPPSLHINTSASWDQFQVILCSTSTSDMVRAIYKLREFGREQVVSGRKFIVSVTGDTTPGPTTATAAAPKPSSGAEPFKEPRRSKKLPAPAMPLSVPPNSAAAAIQAEEERTAALMHDPYHRYWPRPLKLCAGKCVKTLIDCVFPQGGTVLGGTCEMSGQHMSIACFYGSSFRAKSWARFSIKSPQATFSVEAHEAMNDETKRQEYHIVQNLSFRLGKDEQSRYASTVARVSCQGSPAVKSFHEWFAFVFHDSELDEVHRFPKSDQENSTTNIHLFKHVKIISEMILGLPRVDVNLRTEHWHTLHVPVESKAASDNKNDAGLSDQPKVIVNFMTDFGAPISIDMGDSQAFYFLHQLIQSYLSMGTENGTHTGAADVAEGSGGTSGKGAAAKSKQPAQRQASNSLSSEAGTSAGGEAGGKFVPLPTDLLKVDKRLFECRQWYMEPQVKLLQRIGRDIEPYGVDRVLQRLGFEHARSTIPKWIQRGVLDPLDSLTAAVATQLILRNMRKPPPPPPSN